MPGFVLSDEAEILKQSQQREQPTEQIFARRRPGDGFDLKRVQGEQ